ncbi:metal ABC transporter permease [Roseimaritima sediminicola]|uniref:metal ABC transporter permease n=1 Tax=Roseimaritima sediminicola TaxID=2662066 RepID=UPI0012983FF2|nr:metal ABC transporter permease [Roseimaritima sediminicola]
MHLWQHWSWQIDGWIIAAGVLCAVASSLLGNFLVLRRMSMLGDAITHAILPGLAVAFFISSSRSSVPMFLGAVIVGVLTALFTEWVRRFGHVDEGASMGVVFTSLFALGLVLIVQAADNVDLDAGCVLYGAIELTWLDTVSVAGAEIPRAVLVLGVVTVINALFVTLFFKELKLSSFDPSLATTTGFSAGLLHYLLMVLVAVTAVASFESVGSILVVAMFIVPPATAYMLADRLAPMIWISVFLATVAAVSGHVLAIEVPRWFGYRSTTTAGMMAVAAGALLALAILFSPRHGVLVKFLRRRRLAWKILADDTVALLYRLQERDPEAATDPNTLRGLLLADQFSFRLVLAWLRRRHYIQRHDGQLRLTRPGRHIARQLVRSHRLWEQYLTSFANIDAARVHDKAERLEHFTDRSLRDELDAATEGAEQDPHGSPIPVERSEPGNHSDS